eukprot:scaffold995_cov358-Pavlova_lutheri.AAC.2
MYPSYPCLRDGEASTRHVHAEPTSPFQLARRLDLLLTVLDRSHDALAIVQHIFCSHDAQQWRRNVRRATSTPVEWRTRRRGSSAYVDARCAEEEAHSLPTQPTYYPTCFTPTVFERVCRVARFTPSAHMSKIDLHISRETRFEKKLIVSLRGGCEGFPPATDPE